MPFTLAKVSSKGLSASTKTINPSTKVKKKEIWNNKEKSDSKTRNVKELKIIKLGLTDSIKKKISAIDEKYSDLKISAIGSCKSSSNFLNKMISQAKK